MQILHNWLNIKLKFVMSLGLIKVSKQLNERIIAA
ncbi:hypothetical protein SLEP1_g29757 [Rubroshorea leprosula]|uniref:Uncharacterized protein n=1 Tax=Rubroshorea leprosula TaxID=152421 RepID=A0AAV5JXZ6_9ROSI|nr:hypothetical protein SLEP1_g29757 [Rubroshorea leprosula]